MILWLQLIIINLINVEDFTLENAKIGQNLTWESFVGFSFGVYIKKGSSICFLLHLFGEKEIKSWDLFFFPLEGLVNVFNTVCGRLSSQLLV